MIPQSVPGPLGVQQQRGRVIADAVHVLCGQLAAQLQELIGESEIQEIVRIESENN